MNAETMIKDAQIAYEASDEFRKHRSVILAETLIARIQKAAAIDHDTTVDVLCAACEELGAGMPELGQYRADISHSAATWADCATPHELATYMAAGLAKIERRAFAKATRKRLLVALWNSMPPEDRSAFLDFVQPGPGART